MTRDEEFLEAHLEDWISSEPELLRQGVRWIARQLILPEGGRLDLLGLSRDDQWLVAELKQGAVSTGTIGQVLGYALDVGAMSATDLRLRLERNQLFVSLDASERSRVLNLIEAEGDDEPRRLRLLVAGTKRSSAIEAGADYLSRAGFGVPLSIVTFDVFRLPDGQRIVVREVDESDERQLAPAIGWTIETVRDGARQAGAVEGFDRLVAAAEELDLPVKPWARSVTITGRKIGNPTILYVRPEADGLRIWLAPEKAETFLGFTPEDIDALGVALITDDPVLLKGADVVAFAERFRVTAIAARLRQNAEAVT